MREFLFDCVCFVKGKFLFEKECICVALQHNAIANEFLDIYISKRGGACAHFVLVQLIIKKIISSMNFLFFLDFLCEFLQS